MRKVLLLLTLTATLTVTSGCVVPIWHASPDRRVKELINQSETYRHVPNIWERIWFLDMPDSATPYRTHGGII